MEILNYRVDDRLVHGVVATFWIPSLRVDRVIVIDKESAENPIQKSALRMATPASVNLSVITTEKTIENLKANRYGDEKIMIVVKSPAVFKEMIEEGLEIKEMTMGNIGNIDKQPGSIVLSKYLTVSPKDIEILDYLREKGVKVSAQLTTNDAPEDFFAMLDKKR